MLALPNDGGMKSASDMRGRPVRSVCHIEKQSLSVIRPAPSLRGLALAACAPLFLRDRLSD